MGRKCSGESSGGSEGPAGRVSSGLSASVTSWLPSAPLACRHPLPVGPGHCRGLKGMAGGCRGVRWGLRWQIRGRGRCRDCMRRCRVSGDRWKSTTASTTRCTHLLSCDTCRRIQSAWRRSNHRLVAGLHLQMPGFTRSSAFDMIPFRSGPDESSCTGRHQWPSQTYLQIVPALPTGKRGLMLLQ